MYYNVYGLALLFWQSNKASSECSSKNILYCELYVSYPIWFLLCIHRLVSLHIVGSLSIGNAKSFNKNSLYPNNVLNFMYRIVHAKQMFFQWNERGEWEKAEEKRSEHLGWMLSNASCHFHSKWLHVRIVFTVFLGANFNFYRTYLHRPRCRCKCLYISSVVFRYEYECAHAAHTQTIFGLNGRYMVNTGKYLHARNIAYSDVDCVNGCCLIVHMQMNGKVFSQLSIVHVEHLHRQRL